MGRSRRAITPPPHSVECAGTGCSSKGCAPAEPFSASPDASRMAMEKRQNKGRKIIGMEQELCYNHKCFKRIPQLVGD